MKEKSEREGKEERKKEERKKKAQRLAGIETLYLNNTRRMFYHCVTTVAQLLQELVLIRRPTIRNDPSCQLRLNWD